MHASSNRGKRLCTVSVALAAIATGCIHVDRREPWPIDSKPAIQAVATAHPLASRAALDILAQGGTPIDAAIAAQMVLGLVEPQSSGVGGGSLLMLWDAASGKLTSFDGLASAPGEVTAGLRIDTDGTVLPATPSRRGGRTVAVPGTLPTLKAAHERYGKLPWSVLFEPAIEHALRGFPLPAYLHAILSQRSAAKTHPDMVPYYFGADGNVLPIGSNVRNSAYAETMRRIAEYGPEGLLRNGGARRIVAAAQRGFRPTSMTERDLYAYRVNEREPLCGPFVAYKVCTVGPASFGGIVVLQILQLVEARSGGRFDFDDPDFVHLYAEAGRLAQADRRRYVGDPGFVNVPTQELLAPDYLHERAQLIDRLRAQVRPAAGNLGSASASLDSDTSEQAPATSQIAIVDRAGNAISLTTTINLNFGSRLMVDGFVLNNAMINFSPAPEPGRAIANQMAPGKRPVSAMAPTIVFDASGKPVAVGGAAGGGYIVDYIASSLIEMLANGRTPAEALARGHVSTALPGKLRLERETAAEGLAPALQAKGHDVEITRLLSGLGFLKRAGEGWIGAADPRRDGVALGR